MPTVVIGFPRRSRSVGKAGSCAAGTVGSASALSVADLAVEAMALARQGQAAEARQALQQSRGIIETAFSLETGEWWHDLLAAYILSREADALIHQAAPH